MWIRDMKDLLGTVALLLAASGKQVCIDGRGGQVGEHNKKQEKWM
jgi:hypothetical protein